MKPTLFAVSAAIILLTSATSNAGNGYFNQLGRNLGYGISDGYHAQRYCLNAGTSCTSCSPAQQPVIQQPIMPQPMMAPGYSQGTPHQFPQTSYPVGYPATQTYQPWYQPYGPGYSQPATRSGAIPNPRSALHW